MKKTKEDVPTSTRAQVPPNMKDCYTLRCRAAAPHTTENGTSVKLDIEFVEPTEKEFGGKVYDLSALSFQYYLGLGEKSLGNTLEVMEKFGLDPEIDDEEPDTDQFEGITFSAIVGSEQRHQTKPDPENPRKYVPILDGEGKPIVSGWQINAKAWDILGVAEEVEGSPLL